MLMRKTIFFLIAVAALAFTAHGGEFSAGQGANSVEPAIANSLSDLGVSTQDDPIEQTEAPLIEGYTEDGVQLYGINIYEAEPGCEIYYRCMVEDGGWSDWMVYIDAMMFTEPGHYCIEAFAVAPGKAPSDVVAYEFVLVELTEYTMCPKINIIDHDLGKFVDIIENEPNCNIYFRISSIDGEWSEWIEFISPFVVTDPGIYFIEAYAQAPGKTQSDVVAKGFVIEESEQTMAPIFNGFTEDGVQGFGVYIYESEPGCDIYYRYQYSISYGNSSEWSEWMQYTDAVMFTEPGNYRIEAYAVAIGKMPSDVVVYEFTVMTIMQPGDLNHDGIIGIEDVTTLIDIIISKGTTTPECDVNQDGSVDIADVTDLIDYILAN